jgi:hypothetical protein
MIISQALQIQGSVQGIVLWYSPWTMTQKLKMPVRSENYKIKCKLIEGI